MAVFTPVSFAEVNELLAEYSLGPCQQFAPATSGIENTTYLLTTQSASSTAPIGLVLTLFEMLSAADIDFYAQLLAFLHAHQLMVPLPLTHPTRRYQESLNGKPALFLTKIDGQHLTTPTDIHAEQISVFLARLHICTATYPLQRINPRDFYWIQQQKLRLTAEETALFKRCTQQLELVFSEFSQLPSALIHGDLFVDNALFLDDTLSGVIDFYNAHTGPALWDLAIAVLAWCSDHQGQLNTHRMQLMLAAYQSVRPFIADEQKHWFNLLQYAALRFWVSRLLFWQDAATPLQKMSTELRQQKNPQQFKNLLFVLVEK